MKHLNLRGIDRELLRHQQDMMAQLVSDVMAQDDPVPMTEALEGVLALLGEVADACASYDQALVDEAGYNDDGPLHEHNLYVCEECGSANVTYDTQTAYNARPDALASDQGLNGETAWCHAGDHNAECDIITISWPARPEKENQCT